MAEETDVFIFVRWCDCPGDWLIDVKAGVLGSGRSLDKVGELVCGFVGHVFFVFDDSF